MTADDDEARWLLEEEPTGVVTQLRSVRTSRRRAESTTRTLPRPSGDESADRCREKTGTQEAIEMLQRGRETVPDSPPTKRKKKASVPSWDEILFGSRKPE